MQEADIKAQINGLREQLRRQPSARRLSSPTRRAASPGRARAASPGRAPPAAPGSGGAVGRKSDCVMRVEEMKRQREERRKRAEEAKARRAVEAKDAESRGGIESVDFLRKIREYREAHGLAAAPAPWAGGDVWGEAGRIRVCVRKRPMLKIEELRHDFDVVTCEPSGTSLVVHEPKTRVDLAKAIESQRFACDAVFNEADYVALPPCIFGHQPGLQRPWRLSAGTKIVAHKYFNNTYRHFGQMAQWTGLMTYETDPY